MRDEWLTHEERRGTVALYGCTSMIYRAINRPVKRRVQKKHLKRLLKYIRKPSNEFGFMVLTLHKKRYNLPANVYIDDMGTWTNMDGVKIVLFQTNTEEKPDFNKTLPMTVEKDPRILGTHETIELQRAEIEEIKRFIRAYRESIVRIGRGRDSKNAFRFLGRIDDLLHGEPDGGAFPPL
jgi:hypothetical protein